MKPTRLLISIPASTSTGSDVLNVGLLLIIYVTFFVTSARNLSDIPHAIIMLCVMSFTVCYILSVSLSLD
ncbi:uncharacterized protein PHALS_13303 [Plasmopara halstedii]|uniref:Uncharacterized protein n=1 Tax=Plasmopara halstedii TaxID=4781 RepID=A0A0P1ANS0_PLAHL|nr:uncharacterized protein PHALS_13303 [Plasmopara halstedii]CEG43085.1 hypothetical protein PHALS_13303 [Plasmopara halstedii]|eukprot:XP_024579454.1 hypothetical protein PHALS_13303 [Plasmopara halstedii]